MHSWSRFLRSAVGRLSSARGICHSHSLGPSTSSLSWSPLSVCQGTAPSTSGRDTSTLAGWSDACLSVLPRLSCPVGRFAAAAPLQAALGVTAAAASHAPAAPLLAPGSVWSALAGQVRGCQKGQLSRQRVFKGAAINDNIMPNTTQLKFGLYGIRALSGKRVAANTLEAVRRTLRRKLKKTARLWVRLEATVPVTRKPLNIRMGKGKGAIAFYATAVRPGQIIYEMDRVPRTVALQAMQAAQHKFPVKLGFVEWS